MEFLKKPTHYYMKPLERALQTEDLVPSVKPPEQNKEKWSQSCAGAKYAEKKTQLLLDFLDKYKEKKFFAFAYYDVLTHDNQNGMSLMKKYVSDIFEKITNTELHRKTLIVFFSDHGTRVSSYVYTDVGFYEARLPFMYIIFPQWFRRKYKKLHVNLQENSRKLTSNFDVYKTLLGIAHGTFHRMNQGKMTNKPGISLLEPLSGNRTCKEAGVPSQWCACVKLAHISMNSRRAIFSAIRLVKSINRELESKAPGKCATYKLHRVVNAESPVIQGAVKLDTFKTMYTSNTIFVTVKVTPGPARFRGLVPSEGNLDIEVERLDRYGNQSYCIRNDPRLSRLRHKCYCK